MKRASERNRRPLFCPHGFHISPWKHPGFFNRIDNQIMSPFAVFLNSFRGIESRYHPIGGIPRGISVRQSPDWHENLRSRVVSARQSPNRPANQRSRVVSTRQSPNWPANLLPRVVSARQSPDWHENLRSRVVSAWQFPDGPVSQRFRGTQGHFNPGLL